MPHILTDACSIWNKIGTSFIFVVVDLIATLIRDYNSALACIINGASLLLSGKKSFKIYLVIWLFEQETYPVGILLPNFLYDEA